MSEHDVRMVVLSTDDLDESIRFYSETLGMPLKFRDGAHFAAIDGGSITLALATAVDHPLPGKVVVGIKTNDVDAAAKAIGPACCSPGSAAGHQFAVPPFAPGLRGRHDRSRVVADGGRARGQDNLVQWPAGSGGCG